MKRPGVWDLFGLSAAIIFAGAMLTSYLQQNDQQVSVTEAVLDASEGVQPGHEWIGLYMGEARVGYAHLEKSARDDGGFTYAVDTRMTTSSFGTEVRLELDIEAQLNASMTLEGFKFSIKAGPARFSGAGTVQGKTLTFSVNTGGQTLRRTLNLKAPPALKSVMGPQISRLDLTPGRTYQFPVFDPITQSEQTVAIEIIGPDTVAVVDTIVPVTHIRQTISGMVLNAWINSRGEMLRQELGMGLVAVRETEAQATSLTGGPPVDLAEMTMIPVDTEGRGLPIRDGVLELMVSGASLADFEIADYRQSVDGQRVSVRKEPLGKGLPLDPGGRSRYLQPELLIQSDHPTLVETARIAVGAATNTTDAARAIMGWINANIEQRSVIGVPSAIETLNTRVGDCNEHTHLFIALARAVGVPARSVTGLVYQEGRYGYHAWAEVKTASGWVSVDPTWTQMPVDLGHLALLRGGLGEQAKLTRLFGKLKIVPVK